MDFVFLAADYRRRFLAFPIKLLARDDWGGADFQ
jgi:hypothetical protein